MKILIVEDNLILCGMIEKWLQKAGYEVLTTIDEPGARSILKKQKISLVLADVRLPEGDGICLLEWMVRSRMEIPFIVMTDYACYVNPAKRKAMAVKNEKRFLKQKRNALKNPGYSRHPVKTQASFKRLLKAV